MTSMKAFNIYLTGVGGQGIGLISEIILRAADHSGQTVIGVDTHGLAQRGGIVASQIRIGTPAHSPLIPAGSADLAISLERHEALRAAGSALCDGGDLIYYDTTWQPLDVRLGKEPILAKETINAYCRTRNIKVYTVHDAGITDARMQNIAVLREIDRRSLIPEIGNGDYRAAMEDLMAGSMLTENMAVFTQAA